MVSFDTLPGRNIHYPILPFPAIQQRPVVQTAALAAQFGKQITDLAATLSPEERKRKEMEFAILGTKLRAGNQENEIRDMQMQKYKESLQNTKAENQRLQDRLNKSFNKDNAPTPSDQSVTPPKWDFGDTHPLDYYGHEVGPDNSQAPLPTDQQTELPDQTQETEAA
jgi:hypothetical protein